MQPQRKITNKVLNKIVRHDIYYFLDGYFKYH